MLTTCAWILDPFLRQGGKIYTIKRTSDTLYDLIPGFLSENFFRASEKRTSLAITFPICYQIVDRSRYFRWVRHLYSEPFSGNKV